MGKGTHLCPLPSSYKIQIKYLVAFCSLHALSLSSSSKGTYKLFDFSVNCPLNFNLSSLLFRGVKCLRLPYTLNGIECKIYGNLATTLLTMAVLKMPIPLGSGNPLAIEANNGKRTWQMRPKFESFVRLIRAKTKGKHLFKSCSLSVPHLLYPSP